jgi:Isochorismatase family
MASASTSVGFRNALRVDQASLRGGDYSDDKSVLIVVDVQNCFLPGGSLAVKDGDQVVPIINRIAKKFAHVVLTQDWHTPGHVSFASAHPGKAPFEVIKLPYWRPGAVARPLRAGNPGRRSRLAGRRLVGHGESRR